MQIQLFQNWIKRTLNINVENLSSKLDLAIHERFGTNCLNSLNSPLHMKPGNDNCHAYVKIIQLVSNEKYVILVVGVECADQRKSRKNKILKNKSTVMPRGWVLPRAFQGFLVLSWGLISQCLCLILESLWVEHVLGAMTQMLLNYF